MPFKEQQEKIIKEHLTRKQVADEIAELKKKYWDDLNWSSKDEMWDHSDAQGYDKWKESDE